MFQLKALRPEKYREAVVVADDAAKDTLAYLKKMRQEELRQERAAEGSGGKE
jgi:prophage tail gpP-like protein